VSGQDILLEKHSRLGPIGQVSRTRITKDGLEEDVTLTALEDGTKANFLYVFMHCWGVFMTDWLAETRDGLLSEPFYSDNRHGLMQDARWVAVYSSDQKRGAIIAYPEMYVGIPKFSNILWERPRDRKLYLKIEPPRGQGTQVRYRCRVAAFSAEADWKDLATALAHHLTEDFHLPALAASAGAGGK